MLIDGIFEVLDFKDINLSHLIINILSLLILIMISCNALYILFSNPAKIDVI